jgi:hypothetical protein
MKLNLKKLHQDRKDIEAEIKMLKGILRESHQPRLESGSWDPTFKKFTPGTIARLKAEKQHASRLYQLIAHSRRKVHFKQHTSEQQAEAVELALKEYALESENQAA